MPRDRRFNFDALAIGAPLSAAFVGVLLADADAIGAGGTNTTTGHEFGAVRGTAAGGVEVIAGGAPRLAAVVGAQGGDSSGGEGSTTSGTFLDPVSASVDATMAPTARSDGGPPNGSVPPSQPSAAVGAKAAALAGTSVTLTFGGVGGIAPVPIDGADSGDGGDGSAIGDIGSYVEGTAAGDVIHGTENADTLAGGAGDDIIYGYAGDDRLFGNEGDDQLYGGSGDDLLDGGVGDDLLDGGTGDDRLLGDAGDDQLYGGEGQDILDGGPGDDLVDGGPGHDRAFGGTGDDVLVSDDIHDVPLEYDRGADGGGSDLLRIEPGFASGLPAGVTSATFVFSDNLGIALPDGVSPYRHQVGLDIEHLTLQGNAGHDVIADGGDNVITGDDGDNVIYGLGGDDDILGGAGADRLDGGAGDDLLRGGADDDILYGGTADDELRGGAGDDVLNGGPGADRLFGEAGDDTYVSGLHDSAVDHVFDHEGSNRLTFDAPVDGTVETAILGDDLHVVVDKQTAMVVDDYVGYETTIAGIEIDGSLTPIDELMADGAGAGPPLATDDPPVEASSGDPAPEDLLAGYLSRPSHTGSAGDDDLLGTSRDDWLSGRDGEDHLQGRDGRDTLEGGAGSDLLEGGEGADRYLFHSGENGLDTIRDGHGANFAELDGFAGNMARGVVLNGDLVVVIDHAQVFTVEDFADHQDAFTGIELNGEFVTTDDLLA